MIYQLVNWMREEWRLARLHSWQDEPMGEPSQFSPCTSDDPRCKELAAKQAALLLKMNRIGMPLMLDQTHKFSDSASTNVADTFRKVRAINERPAVQPVAIRRKRI